MKRTAQIMRVKKVKGVKNITAITPEQAIMLGRSFGHNHVNLYLMEMYSNEKQYVRCTTDEMFGFAQAELKYMNCDDCCDDYSSPPCVAFNGSSINASEIVDNNMVASFVEFINHDRSRIGRWHNFLLSEAERRFPIGSRVEFVSLGMSSVINAKPYIRNGEILVPAHGQLDLMVYDLGADKWCSLDCRVPSDTSQNNDQSKELSVEEKIVAFQIAASSMGYKLDDESAEVFLALSAKVIEKGKDFGLLETAEVVNELRENRKKKRSEAMIAGMFKNIPLDLHYR